MKKKIALLGFLITIIQQVSAQCPSVPYADYSPLGSGNYHLDPIIEGLGNYVVLSEWYYYPESGTGNPMAVGHFSEPGTYQVWITIDFDDPQTEESPDCSTWTVQDLVIDCYAVGDPYPVTTISSDNLSFVAAASSTLGTAPFTYEWTCEVPFTDNGDGTITVPFGNEGYIEGTVVITDANGCYSVPLGFFATNPEATCTLELNTTSVENTVTLDVSYLFGNDDVLYPYYTIDFGDGTIQEGWMIQPPLQHIYDQPGEYMICVNASPEGGGCENEACTDVSVSFVASADEEALPELSIYPNPSAGQITIVASQGDQVMIRNTVGQIVYSSMINSGNTLEVSDLTAGIYFVQRTARDNKKITQKLVVR